MKWGPTPVADGRWRFALWAPGAKEVGLEVDGRSSAVEAALDGWFTCEADAQPGQAYSFTIDDGQQVPDPASRGQAGDVHGPSLLIDPAAYRWRTAEWRGRPWEEAVICEVHAGVLGGFKGVAEELPRLAELGITAIELMPVNAFSGTRNWGYDGVLPYAPAAAYGSPDDLKALVDRAHELGLMILLDVVYNHFGPDGNYLGAYAPDFFHPEVHTPWGAAIAFDRDPVRRFFIDNALMWLEEYRFDGLRLDAVHAIGDETFLTELAAEVRERIGGDRHVHLILENEKNEASRLERDYTAQWNDDFHNTVHVLLTGEKAGYYRGFADQPAERLARCLGEGFVYQGETPPGGEHPRGEPSGHLPPQRFVTFLQNHDQVGNRALGERLILLTNRERLRAATALLLLCPQVPLLFFGEEAGSRSPFLFFTDFHDALADAVREGRRGEFAHFPAFADEEAREKIPDPNARSTFDASRPEPGPDAGEWEKLYRTLLRHRREQIVPRLAGARPLGAEAVGPAAVTARWRLADGAKLTLFVNLGNDPVQPPPLPETEPFFAVGTGGNAGAFAAWIQTR